MKMNKWIVVSIISVLAVGAIVPWVFYFQEADKVKNAQDEIVSLEWNIFTLGADLAKAEEQISALEAQIAAIRSANGAIEVEVEIVDSNFSPRDITVPLYTTVTWTQTDSVDHTVSSFGVFNKFLAFRDTFSYTFTEPGVFRYYCNVHDNMYGRVIVE
jgi:plastocyanin